MFIYLLGPSWNKSCFYQLLFFFVFVVACYNFKQGITGKNTKHKESKNERKRIFFKYLLLCLQKIVYCFFNLNWFLFLFVFFSWNNYFSSTKTKLKHFSAKFQQKNVSKHEVLKKVFFSVLAIFLGFLFFQQQYSYF